jgi:hypothetical protein
MADKANPACDPAEQANQAPVAESAKQPAEGSEATPSSGTLAKQRISGILQAVLDDELAGKENAQQSKRYPWYVNTILAIGLLLAVGGFSMGMFKLYLSHVSKRCLEDGQYQAAITLLKGNPIPSFINLGGDRDDDPDELLARALYLDAMQKMDNDDVKGGMAELSQIRAGTHEFDTAQQILNDNFVPSSTQLSGGIVEEVATPPAKK